MKEFLDHQWPIIQVIIPLFCALCSVLVRNSYYARIIAFSTLLLCVFINIYAFFNIEIEVRYVLGGFLSPYGIEYRIDHLNQFILCFVSLVFLFSLSLKTYLLEQLEQTIDQSKSYLLYSLILFCYTGLSGIVSTNDLFNLYVFLEIFSLSSYALLCQGRDKRCLIGALDYLILGTIGASFILIAIGIIFGLTGSLNIDDIYIRLENIYNSRILALGIFLFITGCLLKIALMPVHFWMISAYSFASPILLTFLGGVSSVIGFYILLRFIYFAIDYDVIYMNYFGVIIKYLSLFSIIIGSYCALKRNTLRKIILYSATAQIGYASLLLSYQSAQMVSIALSYIIADGLTKVSLFTYSNFEFYDNESNIKQQSSNKSLVYIFFILLIFTLLSNASMPFTIGFINKVELLIEMLNNGEYLSFIIIIFASVASFNYNYRIFKIFYNFHIKVALSDILQISIPVLAGIIFLCYNNLFLDFFSNFFMNIKNE